MHREVGVALAIALLRIGEAGVPHDLAVDDLFLAERQRTQRLGEHLDRVDAHRHFAGARAEERPAHADDVADVEQRRACANASSPSSSFRK